MTTLNGKVVLVTGANRGIGAALVDALHRAVGPILCASGARAASLLHLPEARLALI